MATLIPFDDPYLLSVCNNRKTSPDFFREFCQTTTLFYPEIKLAVQKNTFFFTFQKKRSFSAEKPRYFTLDSPVLFSYFNH